jgi:hypothetical protein
MIRQKIFVQLLVLLTIIFQSCQENLPPSTIVKVIVKDEKGNPIQNIPFKFDAYRYYATGLTYLGSSKRETLFDIESQTDRNGMTEFSKTIPIKDGDVFSSFGFSEKFPFDLYKLKSLKKGSMILDSTKYYSYYKLATFPESSDFTLPLVLSESNDYEIILQKK